MEITRWERLDDDGDYCFYCREGLARDQSCYGLGTRPVYAPDLKVPPVEEPGYLVGITLENGMEFTAIIPGREAEARKAGYSLIFKVCSQECAKMIQAYLKVRRDDAGREG